MAQLKITQHRSWIGTPKDQRATLKALGLGKTNKHAIHNDTDDIRGMIYKVRHLVSVEDYKGGE